jgi:hypothetical protein
MIAFWDIEAVCTTETSVYFNETNSAAYQKAIIFNSSLNWYLLASSIHFHFLAMWTKRCRPYVLQHHFLFQHYNSWTHLPCIVAERTSSHYYHTQHAEHILSLWEPLSTVPATSRTETTIETRPYFCYTLDRTIQREGSIFFTCLFNDTVLLCLTNNWIHSILVYWSSESTHSPSNAIHILQRPRHA